MDWTGGTRRRFAAGKNNAVMQKQKAHFAKARAALQNPRSSQHSLRPSFLNVTKQTDPRSRSRKVQEEDVRHMRTYREESEQWQEAQRDRDHTRRSARRSSTKDSRHIKHERPHRQLRSPSVIYVSSDCQSSSSGSASSHHDISQKPRQNPRQPTPTCKSEVTDEEKLLLAKRRQLLARTDWLGLAALKPLRLKFQSSQDKDRVGKRRKIRSSASRKGKSARPKLSIPLFQGSNSPDQHMMSGALQLDDMQIKIGTDALVSQTQRSRHSRTPGDESVRQPSTDLGPLSEESMLLGPDENDCDDATLPPLKPPCDAEAMQYDIASTFAIAGSQIQRIPQYVPPRPEMRSFRAEDVESFQENPIPQRLPGGANGGSSPLGSGSLLRVGEDLALRMHQAPHEDLIRVDDSREKAANANNRVSTMLASTSFKSVDEADKDEAWKRLFNIPEKSPSRHSVTAMRSSSMHMTTSQTDNRQSVLQEHVLTQPNYCVELPVQRDYPQGSKLLDFPPIPTNEGFERRSMCPESPSASRGQNSRIQNLPTALTRQNDEDARNEALWKQFFVGSQDSSEEASRYVSDDYLLAENGRESPEPLNESSEVFAVSDLGTSNRSTYGGTTFINSSKSNAAHGTGDKCKQDSEVDEGRGPRMERQHPEAYVAKDMEEVESIEDAPSSAGRSSVPKTTIAPATTSILNYKRFKPPKKVAAPTRQRSRFRHPRRTRTTARAEHSIYDLVDSDGMSIAD